MRELLKRKRVEAASGKPCSTLYESIAKGLFPKPVKIGARAVAWPADEVEAVNAARIAGKSDEEVRALVARLEAARAALSVEAK